METKYYLRIITGFRKDQEISIPMQEAHKAYYLFKNPEARGVFDSGIALVGKNIQEIRPDWNKTMGWNETHEIGNDDWNEIKRFGVEDRMKFLIEKAKQIGDVIEAQPELMKLPMGEILPLLRPNETNQIVNEDVKKLADKMSGKDEQR